SATTLAIALLVHSGTLYALPRLVIRRALSRMGEPNSIHFASPPTAASRMVVRPSPDLLYASCPFDLSSGPGGAPRVCHIRPTGRSPLSPPPPMTSSSAMMVKSRAIRSSSCCCGGGQTLPLTDNALQRVIVFAPSKRGLLPFRAVIDDDRHLSALEAL